MLNGNPTLGILMLDGKMADVEGCMACENTFSYNVVRKVVKGAKTPRSQEEALAILPLFLEAAKELEKQGVDVITANCGLIALSQEELASVVEVPVVTSGLMLVPLVHKMLGPNSSIGILTFFTEAVGEKNFIASGWSSKDIPVKIGGVGGYPSWNRFLEIKEVDNNLRKQMKNDLKKTITEMIKEDPSIKTFISECTMLPAVLQEIRLEIDIPIFDILSLLDFSISGFNRFAKNPVRS